MSAMPVECPQSPPPHQRLERAYSQWPVLGGHSGYPEARPGSRLRTLQSRISRYLWNWMFPSLMTRCDLISDSAPVTVIPNSSVLPGSPLSCTVTLKEHAGKLPSQVPENRTVFGDPSR